MKPFDLEAAKRGEPVITRDGRKVELIAHRPSLDSVYKVCAVIDGWRDFATFTERGTFITGPDDSPNNLFMAPRKRTVWVNFYPHNTAHFYTNQQSAEDYASEKRIGGRAYPVEIEE